MHANISSICGLTGLRVWVYRMLDYTDPTWGYAHGTMLTVAEPALGILAGCIPIMSPCYLFLTRRIRTSILSTKSGTISTPRRVGATDESRKSNPFKRLEDHMYPLTDVKVSGMDETKGSSTEALTDANGTKGLGGITVQREVVVDSRSDDGFALDKS